MSWRSTALASGAPAGGALGSGNACQLAPCDAARQPTVAQREPPRGAARRLNQITGATPATATLDEAILIG
ncbi:MAG TPA: hypothetical protein VID72_14130 [Ktedonobacterales bacterium]